MTIYIGYLDFAMLALLYIVRNTTTKSRNWFIYYMKLEPKKKYLWTYTVKEGHCGLPDIVGASYSSSVFSATLASVPMSVVLKGAKNFRVNTTF